MGKFYSDWSFHYYKENIYIAVIINDRRDSLICLTWVIDIELICVYEMFDLLVNLQIWSNSLKIY
jgi:hypothetical protein